MENLQRWYTENQYITDPSSLMLIPQITILWLSKPGNCHGLALLTKLHALFNISYLVFNFTHFPNNVILFQEPILPLVVVSPQSPPCDISLSFMTLTLLTSADQLFCRMSFKLVFVCCFLMLRVNMLFGSENWRNHTVSFWIHRGDF